MKWKSYLANEHSEQIFLRLNPLFRASKLQNTSSASNVNRKCGKKRQTRAQLAPFLSATSTKQPSSKNLTPLHPGKFDISLSRKVYLQTICYFLISLWPALNLAPKVVQALSTFDETSTNVDWSLVRQGPFALRPLVHEQQTASSSNRAFEQSLSHSDSRKGKSAWGGVKVEDKWSHCKKRILYIRLLFHSLFPCYVLIYFENNAWLPVTYFAIYLLT